MAEANAAAAPPEKCTYRSCSKVPHNESSKIVECMGPECCRKLHVECCEHIRTNNSKYKYVSTITKLNGEEEALHFCTKACYDKIMKEFEESKQGPLPWSQDGPGGKDDKLKNSERLLVDWLMAGSNYSNYCAPRNGETKVAIATRISNMLKDEGVHADRTPKSIMAKIEGMESQFKKTLEWTSGTGQGLLDTGDAKGFWDYVDRKCSYFRDLENVMSNRSKMMPLATSDDLASSESSGDSLDEEEDSEDFGQNFDKSDEDEDDKLVDGKSDDDNSKDESEDVSTGRTSTTTASGTASGTARTTTGRTVSSSTSPLSLCKKRDAGEGTKKKRSKRAKPSKKTARGMWDHDDDPLARMMQLKEREQKWSQKEQEQNFQMNMLSRVEKLLSRDQPLTGAQIVALLGPDAKPVLEILNVDI